MRGLGELLPCSSLGVRGLLGTRASNSLRTDERRDNLLLQEPLHIDLLRSMSMISIIRLGHTNLHHLATAKSLNCQGCRR
jgi:hypothetical protein